jgi:hypothetical protein
MGLGCIQFNKTSRKKPSKYKEKTLKIKEKTLKIQFNKTCETSRCGKSMADRWVR